MALKPGFKRKAAAMAIFLAVIAAAIFYFVHDPASDGIAPRCTFKAITGLDCPGCGFQRALHAALHGDLKSAWGYNPILFFLIPVGLLYLAVETMPERFERLRSILLKPIIIAVTGIVIVAWWIIRNL